MSRRSWHSRLVSLLVKAVLVFAFIYALGVFVHWATRNPLEAFVICLIVTLAILFPAGGHAIDVVFAWAGRRRK